MKRILVPTDFSPNATKALNFATEIASAAGGSVILINVNTLVESPFREQTALEKKYNLPRAEAVEQELKVLSEYIKDTMHVEVDAHMYGGTVTASILEAAIENNADMIVMGTLGDSGAKEKLLGSVTATIIGKSTIPVLAVPILSEWAVPKNMLLAVNRFDEQPSFAKPLIDLARMFYARIVVAVYTDQDSSVAADYLENARGVASYGQVLESMYKDTRVEAGKLYGHSFENTIEAFINENEIDLLAMFTHKRGFVESIFNRSMTKKMSYHTNIPLLAIPVQ